MVPVAVNLYEIRVARHAGGDLFRSVQRQKDQYQGLWIVSPDGKVLAGHHGFKSDAASERSREVLAAIDSGLAAFGPVVSRRPQDRRGRDPLPDRGTGVRADGSAVLALYTRYVHQRRPDGPAVIDSITLTAADWSEMLPPRMDDGTTWTLPDHVARQFCRALSPASDQSTMPRPDEVTDARVTGAVRSVSSDEVALDYHGEIAASHTYEGRVNRARATLAGVGTCTVRTRRMTSLALVLDGLYRHFPPYDSPRETGALIEWRQAARE
jgi:hypothetical protein